MGGVQCDVCGKRLRTRYNLKIHMAVHTGAKPYICDTCGKGFQQKWNLITHSSRVHNGEKPFQCQDCGRTFGYASHFKAHVKVHFLEQLNVPDDVKAQMLHPYECSQCPRRFESARLLDEHSSAHSGERLFTCDSCGKTFPTRRNIVKHFQRRCNNSGLPRKTQPCGTDPTPCEICGKVVARYSMRKHINIHTRKRTYPCKLCHRTFLESGQLTVHARTHTGQKPHVCEVCGRAHAQLGNLLAHRRRHHGLTDKPVRSSKETTFQINEEGELFSVGACTEQVTKEAQEQQATDENELKDAQIDRNCTGNETFKDFLKIADQWIAERLEETKAGRNASEETETIVSETPPMVTDTQEEDIISEDEDTSNNAIESDEIISPTSKQEPYDANKEVSSKILDEIGRHPKVKTLLLKAQKKKKRYILMWIIRKLGDRLPANSVVVRKEDGSYIWRCWECSVTQKSRPLFLRHRLVHAPPHMRPHSCKTCGRTFTQAGNLQHHLLVHRQEHRYFCEVCNSGFRHKSHFTTHRKRHDDPMPSQRRFQCDTCGKVCLTRFHLTEHIRIHTKERPFLCQTCGRQFAASSTYTRHLKKHDGKGVACTTCGKLFTDPSSRRRHQAAHIGQPEHACICGKTFTQKASLNRHAPICPKAPELAVRLHQCLVCPKTFLHASGLKRHSASHDPTRRFACDVCNILLKSVGTLARHRAQQHASE